MRKKVSLFSFTMLVMATLGMSSCQDRLDNVDGFSTSMDNSIQVKAMIGSSTVTKGSDPTPPTNAETTADSLKYTGGGFNLFAWQGTKTGDAIIPATTFSWDDTGDKFVEDETSTTHYWPEGLVKFWAYAVDNKSVESDLPELISQSGSDKFTMTYEVSNDAQNDPVFAYAAQSKHADDNYVNITFQHMLSRVSVNASAPYFSTDSVRLLSFGFKGVGTSGTFTYTPTNETAVATDTSFASTCWSATVEGGIGTYSSTEGTPLAWYTAGSGTTWTSGNGPVIPAALTSATSRLSYTNGSNTVTVPWLNVIPGGNVADSLIVTYEYYDPKESNWVTKVARILIPTGSVPAKSGSSTKDIYNPGYQYVYSVCFLGQEGDDAEVQQAQVVLNDVSVSAWTSESVAEVKTDFTGSGQNLKTIIEDAKAFSTVTLLKDVDLADCGTINVEKTMTIDLGGYTVTADTSGVVFRISSGANVTIKNGTLTDGEVVDNNNQPQSAPRRVRAKVATKGGDEPNDTTGIIRVSGGAILELGASNAAVTISNSAAKHSCIYVEGASTKVTINNGTFTTTAENTSAVTKASGTVEVATGGSATFTENGVEVIPTDAVEYKDAVSVSSYADLINAIKGKATHIKLGADITLTTSDSTIVVDKTLILDLNGKKLAAPTSGVLVGTGPSNITKDAVIAIRRGAKLTVTGNGTITSNGNSSVKGAIKLTIYGESATGDTATLVVNGGTITGYEYAINGNGNRHNTEITINGGTLNASNPADSIANQAIYQPQDGTVTINGGTLTGYSSAIEMRAGTLNIKGGTFTATATNFSCNANGDGQTTKGAAIAIAQHTTKKDISVTISGGTFSGVKALNEFNPQANDPTPQVTINVTGGTFNGAIDIADADNASISGGTFTDIVGASKYVAENKTIKLAESIELGQRLELTTNKAYTIDLNGKTVTSSKTCGNGSAFDVKAGTVTITNGTITSTAGDVQNDTTEVDAITVRSGATANLSDLTITVNSKNGACAYAFDGGDINIASGTYTNNTTTAYQYRDGWQGLVVNQANVTTKLINITAGTFNGQSPADGDDSWSEETNTTNGGFIKSGSTCTGSNRVWTVTAAE